MKPFICQANVNKEDTIVFYVFTKGFFINFTITKFRTMKNIYLLIIATAFFSQASAQRSSSPVKSDFHPVAYVDVNLDGKYNSLDGDFLVPHDFIMQTEGNGRTLFGFHILWVFNDVGNHNTNKVIETGFEIKQAGGVSGKKLIPKD